MGSKTATARSSDAIVEALSRDAGGPQRGGALATTGRIEEAARQAVRRVVRAHLGKKPLTDVHIVRI